MLWEVFHDLFHPSGRAALTNAVARTYFKLLRGSRGRLSAAGPLTLVTVILIWVAALVVGFALIYLPFFPDSFRTSTGGVPSTGGALATALYISAETLTTLGYGDFPPHANPLRVVATAEALVGFALVTASVSEIVLIYPALTRMRNLALGVCHTVNGEAKSGVRLADCGSDVILAELATAVTREAFHQNGTESPARRDLREVRRVSRREASLDHRIASERSRLSSTACA